MGEKGMCSDRLMGTGFLEVMTNVLEPAVVVVQHGEYTKIH